MPQKIFFSWQSDTPAPVGRNLIESALKAAIKKLGRDDAVEPAIREELAFDKDTKDEPGSPPIVETILRKIDEAAIVVADLTCVASRGSGGIIPNPNVLIEYGWALKRHGHSRLILVMNEAFGKITDSNLPFDLRHMRRPVTFEISVDSDPKAKPGVLSELTNDLATAIRTIINKPGFVTVEPKAEAPPFQERMSIGTRGHFQESGAPIGVVDPRFTGGNHSKVYLREGAAMWLRLLPSRVRSQSLRIQEIKDAIQKDWIFPIGSPNGEGLTLFRSEDGVGVFCTILSADKKFVVYDAVMVFKSGEIWTLDTRQPAISSNDKFVVLNERDFKERLEQYSKLLENLGFSRPFRWIAGMEDLQGKRLMVPNPDGTATPRGSCLNWLVTQEGTLSVGEPFGSALKPFFEEVYDAFGLKRASRPD